MKVLFIYPPPFEDKIFSNLVYPPLGILFLASVVREMGHDVSVFDANVLRASYEETINYVKKIKPDIVGITAATANGPGTFKLAARIKEIEPSIKIISGGPHITAAPEECLKDENIDYILVGEGEVTIKELIEALDSGKDLRNVKGIGFKNGKKIIITSKRELIRDLDSLPMPAYDLIPIEKYWSPQVTEFPFTSMITSRGCPYHCIFCGVQAIFGYQYRFISAEKMFSQVQELQSKFGVKTIIFKDSEFALRKDRIEKFCDLVVKNNVKIKWLCNARVNNMTKELLTKMKNAGCYSITYGVESGSERILKVLKKNITLDQAREAIKLTKEVGIECAANFILGNPTETREDIEKTISFAIELDPDYVMFSNLVPYPGTEIYEIATQNKWIFQDFSKVYKNSSVVMNATNLTTEELSKYMKKAYFKFYLRPKFIFRAIKHLKLSDFKTKLPALIDILR